MNQISFLSIQKIDLQTIFQQLLSLKIVVIFVLIITLYNLQNEPTNPKIANIIIKPSRRIQHEQDFVIVRECCSYYVLNNKKINDIYESLLSFI